ncbi:MAG: alpha/beta fold hydrolase [Deltaproteobacteria bacterium]|nr:alpha/beta fold hydrolase [Deltaproteobacteria bacterium]
MKKFQQLQVLTDDHYALTARQFEPQTTAAAGVVIGPAMGVQQQYYATFANWLSQQGFLVITFDYRGIGLSSSGLLRGFKANILDWARLDSAVMVRMAANAVDGKPLYWIGHSLGGQIFPFLPNHSAVNKMITIASGTGYWRDAPPRLRLVSWYLWYLVVPLSLALFKYFPGRRLRKVGNLPHGVMTQWRRWCLHPEYAVGVEGEQARNLYAQIKIPITSLSFTDDEFMSARNIESLHEFYTSAERKMRKISPEDIGSERIGHFGFFRKQFKQTLWEEYLLPELS